MKKLLLLLVAPCVIFSTLSAQITQKEADEVVQQRLNGETKPYTVYAKEEVQTEGFTVITATGETLELEYPCWVYYVDYTGEINGKYLIVKENSGNLLEVKTKKDTGPDDLTEWRVVAFEIPFTKYSLEGTACQWINLNYDETVIIINSEEELANYINCTEGSYPVIDFSRHTLLLASGWASGSPADIITIQLQQISDIEYSLYLEIRPGPLATPERWNLSIMTPKLLQGAIITLNVQQVK